MALPSIFNVLIQKSTPIVGIPAEVNTPSVYLLTKLVLPTPASPIYMMTPISDAVSIEFYLPIKTILNKKSYSPSIF